MPDGGIRPVLHICVPRVVFAHVVCSAYTQNRDQLRIKTYNMLTRLVSWEYFSNHTAKQSPPVANSLEAIHDDVHNLVGGLEPFPGHMSDTSLAGECILYMV